MSKPTPLAATIGEIMREKKPGDLFEIEIVEEVLRDAEVRELRAFAAIERRRSDSLLPGDEANAQAPIDGPAIHELKRRGLLFRSKLTRAGWNALAAIERIPFGAPACIVCGCTEKDCSGCIRRTGAPCSWLDRDETICSACESSVAVIEDVDVERRRVVQP